MADRNDSQLREEEKKIPVFTVLKNGSILKNIFLLDKPPEISNTRSIEPVEDSENSSRDSNEVLLVGRHPDCNIMLEHPSISRFHLRIHSKPSLQKLSVMDLTSAHGTWVSEKKIEPQVLVELNEGDRLRLGASTRIYRLHWLPISLAFDVGNPLTSPSDVVLPKENEEENNQDENLILKAVDSLLIDENSVPFVSKQKTPSAPPMPETMNSSFSDEEESVSEGGMLGQEENHSPLRKKSEQRDISSLWSVLAGPESVNSSLPVEEVLSENANQPFDIENQSPQANFCQNEILERNQESPPLRSDQKCSVPSLWSRRGKPVGVLEIHTSRSRGRNREDCYDAQDGLGNQQDNKEDSISKVLFSGLEGEEELFTPDKENFTPNTMKKFKVSEIKNSKLKRSLSSKINFKSKLYQEMSPSSDKENKAPKVLHERKSGRTALRSRALLESEMKMINKRAERIPFQTLVKNSSGRSKSEVLVSSATMRSSGSVNCSPMTENISNPSNSHSVRNAGKWNMVVDTSCLINKESRKSLKLLQGLKGTQLIIPRLVIRELDCLKRRGSLFRSAKEVSSVLEWIEESMVKTKWWIHVQSSVEGAPIASTPTASPQSRFSEGSEGFTGGAASSVPFSTCGGLMDIVSPTAEDHILESALLFKRTKSDEQLVLLTNDVTLKIKAMAEGLLCETAEEFRESLVNPYSERFLWVESAPRGPTWSCIDDVVLKKNYYHCPIKKTPKASDSAKGLRLILLHNSLYGQINSVN